MANKTFNDVKMNVEHVDLSTDSIRSKLVSNENISTSLGKIARWYTDIIWSDTKATTSTFGIVKIDGETLKVDDSGTLVVDMISAEQVSLSDYEISEQGGDITQDDTVSSAIGKIEKNVQGKENTILRFTKEEYKTAIEQGKGPKPGELFVITDDYDSGSDISYAPGDGIEFKADILDILINVKYGKGLSIDDDGALYVSTEGATYSFYGNELEDDDNLENGMFKVVEHGEDGDVPSYVKIKGLGSAAYTDSSAYAESEHTHTKSDITDFAHTHTESDITNFGNYAGSSTKGGSATSAAKLDTATAGDQNTPVYFNNGIPVAAAYTVKTSVPSGALFTDEKVKQSPVSSNNSYEVLFAGSTGNTEKTEGVGKSASLTYNPSTGTLSATSLSGSLAASNLTGTINAGRLPDTTVVVNSYGPASGGTLSHSGTFDVPYITVDRYGRLTAAANKTFTLPAQYTHPTHTGATSGLYKITVDTLGHVTATTAVAKTDITALGIPGTDTNTTYSFQEGTTNGKFQVKASSASTWSDVTVHGLGSAAFTDSTAYAAASHTHAVGDITGGTNKQFLMSNGTKGAWHTLVKADIPALDYVPNTHATTTYGTCSTAAATAAKVVTLATNGAWTLKVGAIIAVKFTATNTAANPTLNVNNTGAKPVYYNTAVLTDANLSYAGYANRVHIYAYDGTNYVYLGHSVDNNSTYSDMKAATASAVGTHGLVPAPAAGAQTYFLRGDATWVNITPSLIGAAVSSHTHTKSQITDFPTSLPASDVYSWAKAATKPTYTASEVGAAALNHTHSYLPLSGGTMSLGEGLKFHADENYFGTNLDARIISLLDGNDTKCDGGLIIDERATNNGVETVTELLRIRDSEFKWKGTNISLEGHKHTKSQITDFPTSMPASDVYSWAKAATKPTYTASEVGAAATSHTHSYLPLSGGTLTGNMSIKPSGLDGSADNNGFSSGISYPTTFNIIDKNDRILVRTEGIINSSGSIGWFSYVRNYKSDGTLVAQKGLKFAMDKTGALTWIVDDSANFRSAISAAASSHTHTNYLPLSGGTMTGTLVVNGLKPTIIETGSNINSIDDGFWMSGTDGNASSYSNTPSNTGWVGFSTTLHSSGSDVRKVQFAIDRNSNIYVRGVPGTAGAFAAWKTVSFSGHTHSQYYDSGASRTANTVLAAPNGSAGSATFRALVAADIPSLAASKITSGTFDAARLPASGATAGSYGPSANASPAHSGTFSVPYLTVDAAGRVTAISTKTITLPASGNTDAKVTQTVTTTSAAYEILMSETADNTTRTEGARKSSGLKYNPGSARLCLYGNTTASATYNSTNPAIRFHNSDQSQNVELVFTDYDSVLPPASLNLIGNQGNEWFTAGNIMAWDNANRTNSASLRTQTYGTTTTVGVGQVIVGNSTAEGTAGNSKGYIQIYDKNQYRVQISASVSDHREVTIPNLSGTMAIQSYNCIAAVTRGTDSGITNSGYWSGMTTKHGYTGVGANKWRHVLSMDWTGSDLNNWQSQLLIPTQDSYNATSIAAHTLNDGIAYRTNPGSNNSITSGAWITLIDTANYKTFITPANIGAAASSHSHSYLPLSGGTVTGTISSSVNTSTYINSNKGTNVIINSTNTAGAYTMLAKMNSTNGYMTIGTYQTRFELHYTAKTTVDAGTNTVTKNATLLDESGNASWPGTITASSFSGKASSAGSADRATNSDNCKTNVTDPSTTTTYGILFVADPNATEDNALRKSNDFRLNHFRGAAGTEGITELILGNSTAKSAANNSTGRLTYYTASGAWAHLNAGSNTSNVEINLPASSGTLALVGDNNHTHAYIATSGITTVNQIHINPSNTTNSFNEGLRIGKATNGWSNINLACSTTATSGMQDGQWVIGVRGSNGTKTGAVGDFIIEHNNSTGTGLTLHKNGVVPFWNNIPVALYQVGWFAWDSASTHTTKPWKRILYTNALGTWQDRDCVFLLKFEYGTNFDSVIATAHIRTNGNKALDSYALTVYGVTPHSGTSEFDWANILRICYTNNSDGVVGEVWLKNTYGQYASWNVTILNSGKRDGVTDSAMWEVRTNTHANGGDGYESYTAGTGNKGPTLASYHHMKYVNNYWGMASPTYADDVWVRTTTQGIIPYQAGAKGSGHQSLGTSSWYFLAAYIDTVNCKTLNADAYNVGYVDVSSQFSTTNGKLTGLATAHGRLYANGVVFSNPATANDQGWIRVSGTAESDTVLEIATGDDGGAGEQIVVRQYNTSNAVAREIKLLDLNGRSQFPGEVTSTSANAFRACSGGYGVILRNDGNYFYFLLTNKLTDGSENHGENWNTLRPFQMQLSTGRINLGCGINVYTNAFDTMRVRRTDGDNAAAISFSNGTTEKVLGYIGMTASANGGLLRWSADKNTSYTFIDTGNIKTYAVPKPTVIYSGSASCGAKTTTTVTFKSAAPSDATILKIYWTVSGAVGVSEVDAVNVNVLQNVISASAGTTTNIIQFKIASDRKSMTVGPGTTSIVINEIDALIM